MPPIDTPPIDSNRVAAILDQALAVNRAGFDQLGASLRNGLSEKVAAAAEIVLGIEGALVVCGVGKSGHIGAKLAATFASTGTRAFFVHPTEASHGDLGMIGPKDAILALSWSGETLELANIIAYSRETAVPLIAITSRADSTLARKASVPLILPPAAEAGPHGLAPTTSTLLQMCIGDLLAIALQELRGFTPQDFKAFHPGGNLGRQLSAVTDVMHGRERLPLLPLGTSMGNVVVEITKHSFGIAGIVDPSGDLVGVVTDGDLRRHLGNNLLALPVEEVMTRQPKVIPPDLPVGQAVQVLQDKKITALFVVDAGKPVGLVHIHDFLRLGVI